MPPHLPSPGPQYAFGAHLFYFSPLSKQLLLLVLGPVVCNSLYLLCWKTGQSPDHWLWGPLEVVSRDALDMCSKLASSPIHCVLLGRAFLLLFPAPSLLPGLDHDSFMKTQREMGLLRVLLGKSYFVFMMTFLSSAAEGPWCQRRSYCTFRGAPSAQCSLLSTLAVMKDGRGDKERKGGEIKTK